MEGSVGRGKGLPLESGLSGQIQPRCCHTLPKTKHCNEGSGDEIGEKELLSRTERNFSSGGDRTERMQRILTWVSTETDISSCTTRIEIESRGSVDWEREREREKRDTALFSLSGAVRSRLLCIARHYIHSGWRGGGGGDGALAGISARFLFCKSNSRLILSDSLVGQRSALFRISASRVDEYDIKVRFHTPIIALCV